jgi:hypothetical protein
VPYLNAKSRREYWIQTVMKTLKLFQYCTMIGQQKYIKFSNVVPTRCPAWQWVALWVDLWVINSHSVAAVAELTISVDRSAFIWPVLTVSVRRMLKSMKPLFNSTGPHHSYPYTINTMDNVVILTTDIDHLKGLSALRVLNVSNTVDTRRHSNW